MKYENAGRGSVPAQRCWVWKLSLLFHINYHSPRHVRDLRMLGDDGVRRAPASSILEGGMQFC